jgi:hypothetical protein
VKKQNENFEMFKKTGEVVFEEFNEATGGYAFGSYSGTEANVVRTMAQNGFGVRKVGDDVLINNASFRIFEASKKIKKAIEKTIADSLIAGASNNMVIRLVPGTTLEALEEALTLIAKKQLKDINWLLFELEGKVVKLDKISLGNQAKRSEQIKGLF